MVFEFAGKQYKSSDVFFAKLRKKVSEIALLQRKPFFTALQEFYKQEGIPVGQGIEFQRMLFQSNKQFYGELMKIHEEFTRYRNPKKRNEKAEVIRLRPRKPRPR